ncbi:unnamed protein product [Litomosoides sigmodontis]|uniref:SSD domain-containing protein n=1 Tax=Litomosoides sigmodontis TaxID=42156 RepID=A0A3P6UIR4_LITSI|nr:unnamed protein product [Litomosoides sigmodontis]
MFKDEYIREMRSEAVRGLRNPLFRSLQKFLIYSSEIHFILLEKYLKSSDTEIVLEFPYLRFGSMHFSLQHIIYGQSKESVFSLRFLMVFDVSNLLASDIVKSAELQWYQQLKKRTDPKMKLYLLGDELVNYEIQKAAHSTIFYFIIGASLMVAIIYIIISQYEQKRNVAPYLLLEAQREHITDIHDSFVPNTSWHSHIWLLIANGCAHQQYDVGYVMSPSMDIAYFCLCSATAFALCWLLELFVFTPQLLMCTPGTNKNEALHIPKRYFKMYSAFLRKFSFAHIAILLLLFILLGSCIFMTINMEENFAPGKIFDDRSFLAKSLASLDKIYEDHQMVRILVTKLPRNAPALRADIARITSFHYLCPKYTTWIELYEQLYHPLSIDIQEYFSQLPDFLKQYPETAYHVNYGHKNNVSINKISFELCLQGFGKWRNRATVVNDLRRLLPNGYSMFFYDSHMLDLILSIKGVVLEAVIMTVAIMAVICFFFLPAIRIAICTILSLLSIIILVVGSLRCWGAELDVVLMVNVVMAAGFTVDYVSHISYHLFLEAEIVANRTERMTRTLRAIFGPTAQVTLVSFRFAWAHCTGSSNHDYQLYCTTTVSQRLYVCCLCQDSSTMQYFRIFARNICDAFSDIADRNGTAFKF